MLAGLKSLQMRGVSAIVAAVLSLGCDQETGSLSANEHATRSGYRAIEISDSAAAATVWQGRTWRVNAGTVLDDRLSYAIRTNPDQTRIRFELRDSELDRSPRDSPETRRAELSGSLYGDKRRLPNGVPLWGAMLFRHHAWPDSNGMKALTGGVYGQVHIGSRFGGSPALAFRRSRDGLFMVTTRGQNDEDGTIHFAQPVSFDDRHDLVYRVILHPTVGGLTVWLDGKRIVQRDGISIGHEDAGSYWNFGLYFSGGISGKVSAEYARHVYPAPADLRSRVTNPVVWPE